MTKSATVVIAATGAPVLEDAIRSVLSQTNADTRCWIVIDGPEFVAPVLSITSKYPQVMITALPENTGSKGFYGHRIYAAIGHLVNTDYVFLLDQDNWFDANHVSDLIDSVEKNDWDWSHSLRKIHDKDGNYLCNDDCESIGRWPIYLNDQAHLVDTSSYCIKREVMVAVGHAWHWGWGGDRRFLGVIAQHFSKWGTSGSYSLNYRLDGNAGSVNKDFFLEGNETMRKRYPGGFPWAR
jgi:hypothetical protein